MNKVALLPNHIAFIPDGNGRWATKRGLARLAGHRAGVKAINALIRALHAKKTGALIRAAVRCGAILAGAEAPHDTVLPSPLITPDNVARFYNPDSVF